MIKAYEEANKKVKIDYLLTDAMPITTLDIPVLKIIKGDAKSVTIAAASILAKVTRDRILIDLDKKYPEYNFKKHKGYPTKEHLEKINEFGVFDEYRMTYKPVKMYQIGELLGKRDNIIYEGTDFMSKNLVIVESPAKSKTIEKYLGSDYKVLSSKGHIRDLATSGKYGFGVDIEDGFKPNYEPIKGKKKDIAELKKEVKNAEKVYLATDPDREGEAISWHLKDALGIDDKDYERIVFNEITKNAVVNSFKNARKIDDLMVRSQETRRILDRIIGFRLSKLMQSKTGGKSAGRVQSVALKLIVDREKEIEKFIPEEYWTIKAIFPSLMQIYLVIKKILNQKLKMKLKQKIY